MPLGINYISFYASLIPTIKDRNKTRQIIILSCTIYLYSIYYMVSKDDRFINLDDLNNDVENDEDDNILKLQYDPSYLCVKDNALWNNVYAFECILIKIIFSCSIPKISIDSANPTLPK